MGFYTKKPDKKSGDGLALTEWNDLSNAITGNAGLTLASESDADKICIGTKEPDADTKVKLTIKGSVNIGDKESSYLKVRHVDGKYHNSSDFDHLYLNYFAKGKDVYIGHKNINGKSNLIVNGEVTATKFTGDGSALTNLSIGKTGLNILGDMAINDKRLLLRGSNDGNHALVWDGSVDGPFLYGNIGGALGTKSKKVLFWNSNGNVSIGRTSPGATLDVARGKATGGTAIFRGTTYASHFNYSTREDTYIRGGKKSSYVIINDTSGNVGIGTNKPTKAKLEVNGSAAHNLTARYYNASKKEINVVGAGFAVTGGQDVLFTGHTKTNRPLSAYFSEHIACKELQVFSDARIKNVLRVSPAKVDLETLMQIEITDYQMKDQVEHGAQQQKKVIAQQLEKHFPQAVSQNTDVIPNIMTKAKVKENWILLPDVLQVGDRVKLIFPDKQDICEVIKISEQGFQVDVSIAVEEIFVYGKEVEDFRMVDYHAIAMLNVSATQEINRQLQQQKKDMSSLQLAFKNLKKEHQTLQMQMNQPLAKA